MEPEGPRFRNRVRLSHKGRPLEELTIARCASLGRGPVRPSRGDRLPCWTDSTSGEIEPLLSGTTKAHSAGFVRQPRVIATVAPRGRALRSTRVSAGQLESHGCLQGQRPVFVPPDVPPRSRLRSTTGSAGRTERARKPLRAARSAEGSNPSPSASDSRCSALPVKRGYRRKWPRGPLAVATATGFSRPSCAGWVAKTSVEPSGSGARLEVELGFTRRKLDSRRTLPVAFPSASWGRTSIV
jgi:hypothetical protein